jgi:hypothetical protein
MAVRAELTEIARRLEKLGSGLAVAEREHPVRLDADRILDRARALAERHGLKWTIASDREIAITLAMGS